VKNRVPPFAVVLLVLLAGCSTMDQLSFTETGGIKSVYIKDIRGNFWVDSLVVYKHYGMIDTDILGVERYRPDGGAPFYAIVVNYDGSGWRFMEAIHLKTDSKLYSLQDRSPSRNVRSGGEVTERVSAQLTEEILADLRTTQALRVQYYLEPVDIQPAALAAVKQLIGE
jgi:hypothetical protein